MIVNNDINLKVEENIIGRKAILTPFHKAMAERACYSNTIIA